VGATPVLARGNAGVEPTDNAEKAIAAKPKALVPWAQTWPGVKVATRGQARAQGTTAKGQTKT